MRRPVVLQNTGDHKRKRIDPLCLFSSFFKYSRNRLTSVVASLLCEASADERLVCGAVGYLINYLLDREQLPIDLHDMIDIVRVAIF